MTYQKHYAPFVIHYNGEPVARGYWHKARKSRQATKRSLTIKKSKGINKIIVYASIVFIALSMYRVHTRQQEIIAEARQTQVTMGEPDPLSIYKPKNEKVEFKLTTSIYDQTFPANITDVPHLIRRASHDFGISDRIPLAIAGCESAYNPLAKNKYSTATGVFQFVKGTWQGTPEGQAGKKVTDSFANIQAGVRKIANGELSHWSSSYNCWRKKI